MTMIQYAKIPGLHLTSATGLDSVPISEDGQRIGAIPGWNVLINPDYAQNGLMRNRVVAGKFLGNSVSPQAFGEMPNGAKSLAYSSNNRINPDTQINKDAWTVFAVIRLSSADSINASKDIARANSGNTQGDFTPRLSLSNAGGSIGIYENTESTTSLINYARDGGYLDQTVLVMFTFSTREGLRIFADGVEGAHGPEFTTPFDAQDGPGEWGFFGGGIRGQAGHAGLLDIDLGWAEHAGYRRALEVYLFELYGITP